MMKRSVDEGLARGVRQRAPRDAARSQSERAQRKQTRPRRQEIVDVAAEIFREKGFTATTTQDLGDALGILKGSIYYYIDTKDDLLYAIIEEAHDRGRQGLELAQADRGPVLDRLRRMIERNISSAIAHQDKTAVFNTEFRFLSKARQRSVIALRDQYENFLRVLLEQGQREGVVCPDLDVRIASAGMLSMVSAVASWYRPRGRSGEHTVIANITEMAVSSVQCGQDHDHIAASRKEPGTNGKARPVRQRKAAD
jgi:TetR/AcrR family transcriptional regulator, cholesterol catabolism regulator